MSDSLSLREMWFWYRRQMAGLLPEAWRSDGLPASALIATPHGDDALGLARRRRGRESALGTARIAGLREAMAVLPASEPAVLRLPTALLLERNVTLPLAAERDIAGALRLNLETLTPFGADEVYWTWQTIQRDKARGRLVLRLQVLPRQSVSRLVQALGQSGHPVICAEFPRSDGQSTLLPFETQSARRAASSRRLLPALAGVVAGVLLVFVLVRPAMTQISLASVETRIADLRPKLAEADALRRELRGDAGDDLLAGERARIGSKLQTIAMLTAALPDDTSLTELTLSQHMVTLSGMSANAAKLLLALSQNPGLRDVAFAAPVTHGTDGSTDLFSIRAATRP